MIAHNDMIALQARIIVTLHDKIIQARNVLSEAKSELVCIGGPLNDNMLLFNASQLKLIQRVYDTVDRASDSLGGVVDVEKLD